MKKAEYGTPDLAELAAAYAFGISHNHPFIDGNKRTAPVASRTFLWINGDQVKASDTGKLTTFLALASGERSETQLAEWFRENTILR